MDGFRLIADEPAAPAPTPSAPVKKERKAKVPVVRRPTTALELDRALELEKCKFGCNYFARRFASTVADSAGRTGIGITDKQAARLEALCWTYRRQLPSRVVPGTTPDLCWKKR